MPAGLSRFALVVLAAVIVASGVALALRLIDARRAPPIVIVDVAAERPVIVVVDGAVATPGVLTLPPGARLNDAIEAAGGFTDTADAAEMNLARLLDDGERVTVAELPVVTTTDQVVADVPVDASNTVEFAADVPSAHPVTETDPASSPTWPTSAPAIPVEPSSPLAQPSVRPTPTLGATADDQRVDINSATVDELDALPRIGPVLAERIVAYREDNGPYASVDDLEAIDGISAGMVDELRPLIAAEPASR